jgi:hypothetical protein
MIQSDLQSQQLLQQMILADRAKQAQPVAGPPIPADILEGATPIINAVVGSKLREIDDLRRQLGGLIAQNQGAQEKSFILGEVPDWEAMKMDVAKHIHAQLDQLGVPQDAETRRQYFNPVSVVAAAKLIKSQRGATAQVSDTIATRTVVEGRGGGTSPSTPTPTVDYQSMSDADFAKQEAKINAARMRRNSG